MSIIDMTANAGTHLLSCLAKDSSMTGFRIAMKKSGCSGYKFENQLVADKAATDIEESHHGVRVFIDADSREQLQGLQIDYVAVDAFQSKLILSHPAASNHCGCGESFNFNPDEDP